MHRQHLPLLPVSRRRRRTACIIAADPRGTPERYRASTIVVRCDLSRIQSFLRVLEVRELFRKGPENGYPFCENPCGPCRKNGTFGARGAICLSPDQSQVNLPQKTQGKQKHININNFAGLSRDWVAKNCSCVCVCVFFFSSGHSLWGRKKTHKRNPPPKSRDNPVKILFTCFVLYVFFPSQTFGAPELGSPKGGHPALF